jgi:hypothetical protein
MATTGDDKGGKKRRELQPDEIIGRVIPDPANPRVSKVVGYFLGESTSPNYWRLYVTPSLDHYLEFRKEDALDSERFNTGRIVVWLNPDAKVTETVSKAIPAALLRGGISRGMLGGARDLAAGGRRVMAAAGGCSLGDCTPPCDSLVTTCNNTGCGNDTIGYTCGC